MAKRNPPRIDVLFPMLAAVILIWGVSLPPTIRYLTDEAPRTP